MSDHQDFRRPSGTKSDSVRMIGWLGFFLLVFAVAGLAFYLADDAAQLGQTGEPTLATRR